MRLFTVRYLAFVFSCPAMACRGSAAPPAVEPTGLSVASIGWPSPSRSYSGSGREDAWQGGIAALAKELGDRLRWDTRPRMKVAVLDFSTPEGATCDLSAPLAEELTTRLFDHERFSIIERRMLAKVLAENAGTQTDMFDPAAVARLGRLMGADGVITGTITAAQRDYTMNARIIVVESAEVASVAQASVARSAAEQRGSCLRPAPSIPVSTRGATPVSGSPPSPRAGAVPWLNRLLRQEDEWKAEIRVWCMEEGEVCGTVTFRGLRCGGNLVYRDRTTRGYVFDEELQFGSCVRGCSIVLATHGTSYREQCRGEDTGGGSLALER